MEVIVASEFHCAKISLALVAPHVKHNQIVNCVLKILDRSSKGSVPGKTIVTSNMPS